jgi:hypothetical protein
MSHPPPSREAIAAHEAGHAVVGWSLGLHVKGGLWIDAGGGTSLSDSEHLPLVDRIAIWTAGQEATTMLDIEAPAYLASRDHEAVLGLINRLPDDEKSRLRDGGRERARKLVGAHVGSLKAVADALMAAGSLDAATFETILNIRGSKREAPSDEPAP